MGTLPGTGSHEGSQEDGNELLESSEEEEERGSPLDDMRGLSSLTEDDASYSDRIQVLTRMVFKAPDNFDLASNWYQIYQTLLCSLLNQLP